MSEPPWAELLNTYYQNGGWMYSPVLKDVSFPDLPDKNNIKNYDFGGDDIYEVQNQYLTKLSS